MNLRAGLTSILTVKSCSWRTSDSTRAWTTTGKSTNAKAELAVVGWTKIIIFLPSKHNLTCAVPGGETPLIFQTYFSVTLLFWYPQWSSIDLLTQKIIFISSRPITICFFFQNQVLCRNAAVYNTTAVDAILLFFATRPEACRERTKKTQWIPVKYKS